ncbi:MAG: hypothetical protein ACRDYF_11800, partial [Acidimicrobiia bacterium]
MEESAACRAEQVDGAGGGVGGWLGRGEFGPGPGQGGKAPVEVVADGLRSRAEPPSGVLGDVGSIGGGGRFGQIGEDEGEEGQALSGLEIVGGGAQ